MSRSKALALGVSAVLMLQACASTPMGPTVQVNPGPGKSWPQFSEDKNFCEAEASRSVAGQADAANDKAVGAAVVGAALGAALGGAAGGGRGAGTGAAAGGIVGTAVGTNQSGHAQYSIQQQYNNTYVACMATRGNPSAAPVVIRQYTPPPAVYVPPPPPPPPAGYAPPPGAGYAPPSAPPPQ